jgi:hypothetical protein
MHGHGNRGGWNPQMDVGAAGSVFIHVNADDAFMESVGAGEYEGAANSESGFREQYHVFPPIFRSLPVLRAFARAVLKDRLYKFSP